MMSEQRKPASQHTRHYLTGYLPSSGSIGRVSLSLCVCLSLSLSLSWRIVCVCERGGREGGSVATPNLQHACLWRTVCYNYLILL